MSFQRADGCQPTVIVQAIKERRLSNHCLQKREIIKVYQMKENLSQAALTRKYGDQKYQTTIEHRWPNTRTIARPLESHVDQIIAPDREPPLPGTSKTATTLKNIEILHIQQLSTTVHIHSPAHSQII